MCPGPGAAWLDRSLDASSTEICPPCRDPGASASIRDLETLMMVIGVDPHKQSHTAVLTKPYDIGQMQSAIQSILPV